MGQREYEEVELTNMCAVIDDKHGKVLVQERVKSWKGLCFPGGHVEKGEAIVPATIREIKEESGLTIWNVKACGIKDWYDPELKRRYIVCLFSTHDFSGELLNEDETPEGKVYWQPIEKLPSQKLASGFLEMAEMMLEGKYAEFSYEINGEDWKKVFY